MDLSTLEKRIDELIALCDELERKQATMESDRETWLQERTRLLEKNENAKAKIEAMIMRLFSEQEGKVIPRSTFLEEVWGEPGTLETRTVDNFVLRLRKYFEPTPKQPQHILSVRGVGYRFVR